VRFERTRIARELHDQVAQELILTVMQLRAAMDASPKSALLARAASSAHRALQNARQLLSDLRAASWNEHSSEERIRLREVATRIVSQGVANTAITGRVVVEEDIFFAAPLGREIEMILREAVANAVRHSHASELICCAYRGATCICVDVLDDGVGFDPSLPIEGFGLLGMTERAHKVGAALEIRSQPGGGTTLQLRLGLALSAVEAP
jgi:signal transduction histidine kinase